MNHYTINSDQDFTSLFRPTLSVSVGDQVGLNWRGEQFSASVVSVAVGQPKKTDVITLDNNYTLQWDGSTYGLFHSTLPGVNTISIWFS
ncbi:hypothetical protein [Photobacterium sp. 1_MG-2023]|uniref:hypothetical protein n=1 Tax=Photobacterium sp. 1_MG-2023 TaxID=3062646 RepID=UPI0026E2FFD4|nr:hypothetical protein [Photobacterium sp. 1_MG-2023]MDO6709057.1 hypothetical protein [Photobacterium sp. 1_MG-2023]